MANLKDTIVLGNLTVTGQVVASDILVSGAGAGNEFDSIKVNSIFAKDNATIEIANIYNGGDWGIATTGALTLEGSEEVVLRSDSSFVEIESSEGILFTVDGAQPMRIGNNNVSPNDGASLGQGDNPWGGVYTDTLYTNYISPLDKSLLLQFGDDGDERYGLITPGDDQYGCIFPDSDNYGQIGTPTRHYYNGYINYLYGLQVRAYESTKKYYVQLSSTGLTISSSSITPNIGSSSTPFNNVYGKNFYASSDIRLKENIVKSHFDYYNIINKIQLVNYTWKSDEQHSLHHGLIAQQLKEVLPEELHNHLISESAEDDEKMMSVNDGKLVYFALGALQQQLQINNKLEQRIQKLEELIRGDE